MSYRNGAAVHLLGPGAVGSALLGKIARSRHRLVAVTDSTATLHDARGLDVHEVSEWKRAGRSFCDHDGALELTATDAVTVSRADVVVDTSSTDHARAGWTTALDSALDGGATLALAAKAALCDAGARWLQGPHAARIGCNAVLGGTGRAFVQQLPQLRTRWRSVAIVGNASTTTIIQALECGLPFSVAVGEARRLGYLEADPDLDLRGADAAVKLAIVAGALLGQRIDPASISCDDIRNVDPLVLRARARRGDTTRLVARASRDGELHVRYELLPRDSVLAVPCGRVLYEYTLDGDERRLHVGAGLGAAATADALWDDVSGGAR